MAENGIKTYTCPNCGAQITNTHNCEYCGSSLVQFAVHGIDVAKTQYMNDDYVFPGLKEQLEKNLKLQIEHPNLPVATEVFWEFRDGSVNPFSIRRSGSLAGWSDNTPIDLESRDNGLRIALDFCKFNDSSAHKEFNNRMDSKLSKFKKLDSFPLFTSHYCHSINPVDETERYGYQYALDFGEDVEGAARLVSEILTKVYGVSLEENFYMYTNAGRLIGRAREFWSRLHGYAYDANDANDDDDGDEEDTSTTQNSGCMVAAIALLVPTVYTVVKLLGTIL